MTTHTYGSSLRWTGRTRPVRLTAIVLRPVIVAQGATHDEVERLLHKAHRQCYVANSLTATVTLEPEISVQ